jgi:hypothetical protein
MKYLLLILAFSLALVSCTKDCEICTHDYMKRKGYLQYRYPIKFEYTDNNGVTQQTKRFYSAKELCKFNVCD